MPSILSLGAFTGEEAVVSLLGIFIVGRVVAGIVADRHERQENRGEEQA